MRLSAFIFFLFLCELSFAQIHSPIAKSCIKNTFILDNEESSIFNNEEREIKLVYSVKPGTKVCSILDGTVFSIKRNYFYGSSDIEILYSDSLIVKYSNLKKIKVRNKQKVKKGQIIGKCSTINSRSDFYLSATLGNQPVNLLKIYNLPVKRNKY